jgi:hypothetical protein
MLITIKDLQKYQPAILSHYMSLNVKAIEASVLIKGLLYKQYPITSIRMAMEAKKHIALTAIRLSTKDRHRSLNNIAMVLDAVAKYEEANK